ncbi:hypothetical protein CP981_29790 [Streptomyces platensis]|uniref:Uncharacterized protein n=1 Tax=Streptomyces platensis TaxID=58346 RepID=A0AAE6NNR2_STRPT|nr:DUF6406 domain-containing protein [Streptomyces platensis]OSY40033.1 hypothetical protein BG653_05572 [Streptomyces platensis]QEV55268.1 hypothetical protein CP981_29790 [Streptomyces platensis]
MSSRDIIALWHGIQRRTESARFSVQDINRDSDASVRALLVTVATEVQRHTLRLGETFPVGDETWRLAELTGWPSEDDWTVVLRRVAAAPA